MSNTRDATAAERARRMRERRKRGFYMVPVEISDADLEPLTTRGYLKPADLAHGRPPREVLTEALGQLLEDALQ